MKADCSIVARRHTLGALGVFLLTACLSVDIPSAHAEGFPKSLEVVGGKIVFTQIPIDEGGGTSGNDYGLKQDSGLPEGSRIVLFDPRTPSRSVINLTKGFAAAGRPDVSFDGRRILFVGRKKTHDPLSVWEMAADGSDARQVIRHSRDCTSAIYLSTIYTMGAEEPVYQLAFCAVPADGNEPAIFTSTMDGRNIRQITFNPGGAKGPFLLSDGRLLYGGMASGAPRGSSLYTVNTDGTDVSLFSLCGMAVNPSGPCETQDGWIVHVENAEGDAEPGGALAAVSRRRSLRLRRVVASDPTGYYHSPSALDDGRLLVSFRLGMGGSYGVYVLDSGSGEKIARYYDDPDWHEIDAAALMPRREPAGRSSVVSDQVGWGHLYCLNAYMTADDAVKEIPQDVIRGVRVFKAITNQEKQPTSQPTTEEVLGEAVVEKDGSFFLMLPARTPLRLETLDASGRAIRAMDSWFWIMPKESRGCIGCHEDRERTPPNRHAWALWKEPQRLGVEGVLETDKSSGRKRPREDLSYD